jgi:2-polyprenyl-6-methoxyphenol hydroxylase-like FAD-dependent oxidoreductase
MDILVVGGGASGLAFALECIRHGIAVRIIDKRPARSLIQKATGIAEGVWRQLAPFGVTASLLDDSIAMRRFVFYDDGRKVADVPVPLVDGAPPARLFPQGALEAAMERALAAHGVTVEYGTSFTALEQNDSLVRVILTRADGSREEASPHWLIGADGAHSEVRRQAGMPFVGHDYPEQTWSVAEIATAHWPQDVQAQLFLRSTGVGLFLSQPSPGVVQGILNDANVGAAMTRLFPDAAFDYERSFQPALRRVPNARCGRVWVIGDAAHVQSPVGGQGLNLAIWDGITLAGALAVGDVSVEHRLVARARRVLAFTDFDYRLLATRSRPLRTMRNLYWATAARHPLLARWFFKIISGVW